MARVLIAGIGNIFLGDDAFGTEVARRLAQRPLPEGVRVVDFGIRGLDLAYALLEPHDAVLLVDAVPRGGAPGTLYVIEPEMAPPDRSTMDLAMDAHTIDPATVMRLAASLGGPVQRVLLVGCEPGGVDDMEMTDPVRRAVDEAIPLIDSLVTELLCETEVGAAPHAVPEP
jgi:hydrogenase maturation protease